MAGVLAAVTLLKGLFWIALIPVLKVADEPTHFENVQYRAEHFAAPQHVPTEQFGTTIHAGSPPDVKLAWETTNRLWRNRYIADVRSVREEKTLRDMASDPATRQGSGQLTSTNYPGFYYNAGVPLYEVFRRTSVLTRIAAVRFVSLLFGLIAVVATFFTARLIMRSQALAVAAAIVVMLQPMESQMTAAVNNDAGVIGLAAILLYLQMRFLMRAPEIPPLWCGVLMAVLSGCIIYTKPQGYAMLPGCAFACTWVVAMNLRQRRAWIFAAVTAAIALAIVAFSLRQMDDTGQTAVIATPAPSHLPSTASPTFFRFLTSLDETYKSYLVRSFFGQFGWLEYGMPFYWLDRVREAWLLVELGTIAAVVVGVVRARRPNWLSLKGFLFSAATALFCLGFILFAEHRFRRLGIYGVIQGRNLLFGMPGLAIAAAASYGALVPARFRTLSAAALATTAVGLHAAAIVCIFRYHYGT